MIFAPFTGKDNHGKCVTFGAGLLSSEDVESYVWLFEQFKSCMGHAPKMIITDQDPAIKIAVERSFVGTRHRFCMWHIMTKVPDKIPAHLKKDLVFRKKLCSAVWSEQLEPEEFDAQWIDTITEFGLKDHSWFKTMFQIRHSWIPAYFRDFPMSGLFRTTSMSESENSVFDRYISPRSNLVEFFMHFDSAIDAQRYANARLNSMDESSINSRMTPLVIEEQAATVYTRNLFLDVQDEIRMACYRCRVVSMTEDGNVCVYGVHDGINDVFNVAYDNIEQTVICSCKRFVRVGLLCSHILMVFKNLEFETIPDKYVIPRWSKFAYIKPIHEVDQIVIDESIAMDENKVAMNQPVSEFYKCLGLAEGKYKDVDELTRCLKGLSELFISRDGNESSSCTKKKLFEKFYGAPIPKEVSILPPIQVKTKGSGSRIKSRKEKAVQQLSKPLRMCSKCKKKTNHDARNCGKSDSATTFLDDNM